MIDNNLFLACSLFLCSTTLSDMSDWINIKISALIFQCRTALMSAASRLVGHLARFTQSLPHIVHFYTQTDRFIIFWGKGTYRLLKRPGSHFQLKVPGQGCTWAVIVPDAKSTSNQVTFF